MESALPALDLPDGIELRRTETMGRALFTTRPFPADTVLLRCRPILVAPKPPTVPLARVSDAQARADFTYEGHLNKLDAFARAAPAVRARVRQLCEPDLSDRNLCPCQVRALCVQNVDRSSPGSTPLPSLDPGVWGPLSWLDCGIPPICVV